MIYTVTINGGVWGNRHRSAEKTIAEVQRIIDMAKEAVARTPRFTSSWLTKWHRFDDTGREVWTKKPATIEIEVGATALRGGRVIARWVGGERVDITPAHVESLVSVEACS